MVYFHENFLSTIRNQLKTCNKYNVFNLKYLFLEFKYNNKSQDLTTSSKKKAP